MNALKPKYYPQVSQKASKEPPLIWRTRYQLSYLLTHPEKYPFKVRRVRARYVRDPERQLRADRRGSFDELLNILLSHFSLDLWAFGWLDQKTATANYYSWHYLAAKCGISIATFYRLIHYLRDAGYLYCDDDFFIGRSYFCRKKGFTSGFFIDFGGHKPAFVTAQKHKAQQRRMQKESNIVYAAQVNTIKETAYNDQYYDTVERGAAEIKHMLEGIKEKNRILSAVYTYFRQNTSTENAAMVFFEEIRGTISRECEQAIRGPLNRQIRMLERDNATLKNENATLKQQLAKPSSVKEKPDEEEETTQTIRESVYHDPKLLQMQQQLEQMREVKVPRRTTERNNSVQSIGNIAQNALNASEPKATEKRPAAPRTSLADIIVHNPHPEEMAEPKKPSAVDRENYGLAGLVNQVRERSSR